MTKTYYAIVDMGGPLSIRLKATSLIEAIEELEDPKVSEPLDTGEGCSCDIEHDLEIDLSDVRDWEDLLSEHATHERTIGGQIPGQAGTCHGMPYRQVGGTQIWSITE